MRALVTTSDVTGKVVAVRDYKSVLLAAGVVFSRMFLFGVIFWMGSAQTAVALESALEEALSRAETNRIELERALRETPPETRRGMEFLVRHLAADDARALSADLLLENVREAYEAFDAAPWRDAVPESLFLNYVLPHAVVSEPRERWRAMLRKHCEPLVRKAGTPSAATAALNSEIYAHFNVRYSTERSRADQSPSQAIREGKSSCTGLSILLISACRSVGIPARFVGTPMWADSSGNHSWVEIWDDGWHFTGAAEPTGDHLDEGWFTDIASRADAEQPMHAIYAVRYGPTATRFPLVWDESREAPYAVDVTPRYANHGEPVPEGFVRVEILGTVAAEDRRVRSLFEIRDQQGAVVHRGRTHGDSTDRNDHEWTLLPIGRSYEVTGRMGNEVVRVPIRTQPGLRPVALTFARGFAWGRR